MNSSKKKMSTSFGYPPCCVKWFDHRMDKRNFDMTYLQHKYARHGFIPCVLCAEKLDRENKRLDQLIQLEYRTVDKPFPITSPHSDEKTKRIMEEHYKLFHPKKEH